jgi:hypothetical protein
MSKRFKDIGAGQRFRFTKIDKDYILLKTGDHSWRVVLSNCKTYKVGQRVSCDGEIRKLLLSAKISHIL